MAQEKTEAKQIANNKSPHDWLPPNVREALATAEQRLRGIPSYERAWERVFSEAEQDQLGGDLYKYCSTHHVNLIQVYMQLRDVSQYRATIELAKKLNLLSADDALWLLRETGQLDDVATNLIRRPSWDKSSHLLRIENEVIRTVKRPTRATNIILILDAFQAADWPPRIDDPLPNRPDPVCLAGALRSLNKGLQQINFGKDGTGEGVIWRFK